MTKLQELKAQLDQARDKIAELNWENAELRNKLASSKQAWHKVADGDLPKKQGQKVWLCTISKDYFMANYWDDTEVGGKQFFEVASAGRITLSNVLAWAELPKYGDKENENI